MVVTTYWWRCDGSVSLGRDWEEHREKRLVGKP